MERKTTPSESIRLELEMLDDVTDSTEVGTTANTPSGSVRGIFVVTADPNMRLYLEGCLRRIPRVRLLDKDSGVLPDLIVYDEVSGQGSGRIADEVASLFVVAERPGVDELLQFANSSAPSGFVVTPFDARTLVHAALKLMR